eukprot:UN30525
MHQDRTTLRSRGNGINMDINRGLSQPSGLYDKVSYEESCLINLIRANLEYYFSENNLKEESDSNLLYYMKLDQPRYTVPFHVVCYLPKIRQLTKNEHLILRALKTSLLLDIHGGRVGRPGFTMPQQTVVRKTLRRSVLVYGLGKNTTDLQIRQLLSEFGNILYVAFESFPEGPEPEAAHYIMKKKLADVDSSRKRLRLLYSNHSHKRTSV